MIIIDSHCDTISKAFDEKKNLGDTYLSFNYKEALAKRPMIQVMASFVNPKYKNAKQRATELINYFYSQNKKYGEEIIQIQKREDIEKVIKENKVGVLLSIENGSVVEKQLENVEYFQKLGVKIMSITWNEDNLLGCGCLTLNDTGLTNFGKQYIQKLNAKEMIVDISHTSEKSFWNTISISSKPVVASHSCVYSLCNHPRNLKDDQIKQIAKQNGIIGVGYCTKFLSQNGIATTKEIAEHISYIANLVGIKYVGLGSDFDGLEKDEIPIDLTRIKQVDNLIDSLRNKGFHTSEIEMILGENWKIFLEEQLSN